MPPRNTLLDQALLLVTGLVVALSGCSKDLLAALPDAGVPDAATFTFGCSAQGAPSHTIFLNRQGGTYHAFTGAPYSNPSLNQSTILNLNGSVILDPVGINDTDWEEVMSCVGALLAPYDVAVTDVDPSPSGMLIDHQEIVVLKDATEIGRNGLKWSSSYGCDARVDGIAFVFAEWMGPQTSNRDICESVVQSLGLMAGLDRVLECSDVFSESSDCGDKGITNAELPCGFFEAQDCQCTGLATQNPHQGLISAYGSCES